MADVLLVTGGARGIGRAVVELAAISGFDVAVGYRADGDAAEAVVKAARAQGRRAIAVKADVAEEADVVGMFEQVEAALGPVRALVNSAGVSTRMRVDQAPVAELQRLMAVNVVGLMLCCREAARRMSTTNGGAGGAIVNVGSMAAAFGGRPGASHYAGSKGAVDSFTKGFAREVAKEGIRVNGVRPGVTLTDMVEAVRDDPEKRAAISATIPMGRPAEASEIAAPIVWLLSPKASFVTGCIVDASGGGFVIGAGTG
ncbi:MAG: SDR family oxidoreductase [Alphaproteobacteria bacterium]|nr:SDR family oxidoreductase [Alphaproteobacteria bacterium]